MAARDSLNSSLELRESRRFRSAGSRAYYAAHNACQGIVMHLDPVIDREESSIGHRRLPGQARHLLGRIDGLARRRRDALSDDLKASYRVRIVADYRPQQSVDDAMISRSVRTARQSIRLLEELLK